MTSIEAHVQQPYKYGFVTDIESEVVPPGLNEDVIRLISAKKDEPAWMLEWRLKAYRNWLKMTEPHWPNVKYGPIDYQAISYYAAPKQKPKLESLDQVDPKLVQTFEKLGIPISVIEGNPRNIKITTVEDLAIAEAMLSADVTDRNRD